MESFLKETVESMEEFVATSHNLNHCLSLGWYIYLVSPNRLFVWQMYVETETQFYQIVGV